MASGLVGLFGKKKKSTYTCGSPSQEKYLRLSQIDGSSKALN